MPPKMLYEMRPPGPAEQVGPAPAVHHARREGLRGSWEWMSYAASLPSKIVPLNNLTTSTGLFSGPCIFTGYNIDNTAGGSGACNFRDGTDNTGPYVAINRLPGTAGATFTFGNKGVFCENGVYAEIVTVTMRGAIFVIPLWHYDFTPPGG